MQRGKLRHPIKIQKRTDSASETGQPVAVWSTFARDVPASFDPIQGREFFAGQGVVVSEPARFRINYLEGVVAEMRVTFRDKIWDIHSVEDVGGRMREMYLYCATGLTEG
jgi:SPP1 family predicted phage head-tail adaptor